MMLSIGVVIHGPEVIDSGGVRRVLDVLSEHYDITAMLGGTMGRTAILDAHLEGKIDISRRMSPSRTIDFLSWADAVVLLNHGKSIDSGIEFGRIVVSRAKYVPIIQIEHPMENGMVVPWDGDGVEWAESIAGLLNLPIRLPPPAQDIKLVRTDDGLTRRRIHDVLSGENIRIGGIVAGTAISDDVEIVVEDGRIVDITGSRIKKHGIEKLGRIDLKKVLVRTGSIRRTSHAPRIGVADKKRTYLRIVLIDHDAESSFELASDADLAITIGDDTTAIAGDILYRLGIPIIGITDMDIDGVLEHTNILPGSMILRLEHGYDDIIGDKVRKAIFDKKNHAITPSMDSIREQVITISREKLIEIVTH